jgi:two-component system, chemotaxis family, protein-glutamate methylesterase/glutaminase
LVFSQEGFVQKKIRVLVVDDSGYVVATVSKRLAKDTEIEVIGSARNGIEAVENVKNLRPDVVTMDIVMPEMDGIAALEKIMAECPTPVVMLSALTSENAAETIRALELGAVDFYLKPSILKPAGNGSQDDALITKIKTAASSHFFKNGMPVPAADSLKKNKNADVNTSFNNLVVIGSSTGGPNALMQVIPFLPADIPAGILIVQHMPPMFTRTLAERLDEASKINVKEAHEGNVISKGAALLAPGDFHMTVSKNGKITLNQEPTIHGVRPAVDVTMKSASDIYGGSVVGVVLTGMGEDGTAGASLIKARGGKVLAQDESTSAVYGMPMSVAKSGCVDRILPLHKIAKGIVEACQN